MVTTSPSSVGGVGLSTGSQGATIPHSLWPKHQNKKQKQYCKKFSKDFKNSLYQERSLKKKRLCHQAHLRCVSVLDTSYNCYKTGTVIVLHFIDKETEAPRN